MTALWLVIRTAAWRTLLQDRAGFGEVFVTLCEGYLINNILPFRLGEFGRAFLLGNKTNLDFWGILPTIIIERAMDLAFGVGIFVGTVSFVVGVDWARQAAVGTLLLLVIGFLTLYSVAKYRARVESIVNALGQRISWISRLTENRLQIFLDGLSVIANSGLFFRSLGLICVNWVVGIGQFYLYIKAFFPGGTLLWSAFSIGALTFGLSIPATPGSLGVYELTLITAINQFAGDTSQATALAITIHAIQYLATGIPGLYGLFRDGETLTSIYQKTRRIQ